MKVDELIEKLRELPPELPVVVHTSHCTCTDLLETVREGSGSEKIVILRGGRA